MAEDALAHWRERARTLAAPMRFDTGLVDRASDMIRSAFGDEWLMRVSSRPARGSALPFREHEIGQAAHVAGPSQVAELLELAEYLQAASGSSAFPTLVAGIRSQYETTRLQLGFGFRVVRAGATNREFEPPVAHGRVGDIEFRFGRDGYVAECYVPERGSRSLREVEWLIRQCLDAVARRSYVASVAIQLTGVVDAAARLGIVRAVKEMAGELERFVKSCLVLPLCRKRTVRGAIISVAVSVRAPPGSVSPLVTHPEFVVPRQDPIMFMRVGTASRRALAAGKYDFPTGSHVAVWLAPEEDRAHSLEQDLAEPLKRLGRKLKKKLAQTKRGREWKRIVIVETWMTPQLGRASKQSVEAFKRELFLQQRDVAAVLFVLRSWDSSRQRHVWRIGPGLSPTARSSTVRLVRNVMALEERDSIPPLIARSAGPP